MATKAVRCARGCHGHTHRTAQDHRLLSYHWRGLVATRLGILWLAVGLRILGWLLAIGLWVLRLAIRLIGRILRRLLTIGLGGRGILGILRRLLVGAGWRVLCGRAGC